MIMITKTTKINDFSGYYIKYVSLQQDASPTYYDILPVFVKLRGIKHSRSV